MDLQAKKQNHPDPLERADRLDSAKSAVRQQHDPDLDGLDVGVIERSPTPKLSSTAQSILILILMG
jgi:hypothetical protein